MKILLAEDDFASRKFMTNYLEKYGECDITVDGEEAVDAFMMALEDGEPYGQKHCEKLFQASLFGFHL